MTPLTTLFPINRDLRKRFSRAYPWRQSESFFSTIEGNFEDSEKYIFNEAFCMTNFHKV